MPQSTSLICATPMKLADAVGFGLLLLVNQEEILNDVAVGWSHSNDLFGLLHVKIKPNLSKPCTASHRIDSVKGNNETDLAALHAFKAGVTHDPHGALSSWNATTHFCQWEGVYCDRWRQRVRVLKLPSLNLTGNKGLCGGIPELKLPPCNHMKNQKRRLPFKIRLTVAILCGTSGLILVAALISLFIFRHKKKRQEANREPEGSLPNLSYQSLLKATNGFSPENLIGSGSFGVVYKGTLEQDGITVAIKVFNLEHRGASRSFMAECEVLKNVRHRNLVKVITACSGIDYQGNDFKALVYEYMENGSLENWLHEKPASSAEGTGDPPRNLNLLERLNIVVDVASALEYLHHGFGAPVVHCDLKPSNVLLDDEMVAHVGDFGLAKFLSQGISDSNGNQSSSVGVRGTIGYAPPEYGMGNEPSTHGDVYSFGILVLEIFTGRRPTDNVFREGWSLHEFVKAALPDHAMEVVDHTLVKDIVGEDMDTSEGAYNLSRNGNSDMMLETLVSILGIAVSCSAQLPQDRPDIANVAAKLSSIRTKLIGARSRPQRRILTAGN